jgi:hypothetical protein
MESGRCLARSCTTVTASGAHRYIEMRKSPRRATVQQRGCVVADAMTWSNAADGPTTGPTGPRVVCDPGALLGPPHEERGTVRRAIHDGHSRRKIGERGGDLPEQTAGRTRCKEGALLKPRCAKQNGPAWVVLARGMTEWCCRGVCMHGRSGAEADAGSGCCCLSGGGGGCYAEAVMGRDAHSKWRICKHPTRVRANDSSARRLKHGKRQLRPTAMSCTLLVVKRHVPMHCGGMVATALVQRRG